MRLIKPCSVLIADPPWQLGDSLGKRGAEANYETLSVDEIAAFPRPRMAANSILFLWRISSMPLEALAVMDSWGFTPKTELVWEKLTKNQKDWFGMGRILRGAHETCIIGTRGSYKPSSMSVRTVFRAVTPKKHSAKPPEFYAIVNQLRHDHDRVVELFGRNDPKQNKHRKGWEVYGFESPSGEPYPRG